MDGAKGATEDFVTVVSVGSQPTPENFVTVLSIGAGRKEEEEETVPLAKAQANGIDGHLEEEVEVFRLPGERLGFGLKFEGGNKTSERVRRLFVQSCAEQSPASRAKCSWGILGEGDEVLSIDGVPVTHMTRLDCVRRLKESQLVIRLMVRCRGALRPEVVSAERKTERSKVPPELPSAPPPVPPRKLRQPRGSADGEANPSPVKKSWDKNGSAGSPGSQNGSPSSQNGRGSGKSTSYESCESSPMKNTANGTSRESPKGSPKERSPELTKSKQEPPEAMVYLDARSQCGSTHGSASDDTGSSMSTVVDRFSTSDRVSTISTASTASSEQQSNDFPRNEDFDRSDHDLQLSRAICPFDLERDLSSNPPDYLLRRLANSETHVEARGEVERITAVVAPNTVLIEETITLQPPLSFQDAPLSYGHEARPDLFYTDLAADSTTHFRPIKDDAELVERVNGEHDDFSGVECNTVNGRDSKSPPPLPARNHVNRICVNRTDEGSNDRQRPSSTSAEESEAPILPPRPMPRKDVKVRRKRPPPPPPPPTIAPRKEVRPCPMSESRKTPERDSSEVEEDKRPKENGKPEEASPKSNDSEIHRLDNLRTAVPRDTETSTGTDGDDSNPKRDEAEENPRYEDELDGTQTNKVLEIIEIRKARALSPFKPQIYASNSPPSVNTAEQVSDRIDEEQERAKVEVKNERNKLASLNSVSTVSTECEDSDESQEPAERIERGGRSASERLRANESEGDREKAEGERKLISPVSPISPAAPTIREDQVVTPSENFVRRESEDGETYRSLDEVNDDLKNSEANRIPEEIEDEEEEDDSTDESDDGDYYWQSNLATIGEEEETNSLEYTSVNKDTNDVETKTAEKPEPQLSPTSKKDVFGKNARDDEVDCVSGIPGESEETEDKKPGKETVNGRMDNCGGGQRLPPDGDEFPAAYQEFGNSNNNQQYRFVAATRTTTMTTSAGPVCNESEGFVGADGFKMLASDSNVVGSRSIVLPGDTRVTVASVESAGDESKTSFLPDDAVKKTGSPYSRFAPQNGNVLLSEKKIEIAGYYHKDAGLSETAEVHEKEAPVDVPPPLPLTGPPKVEPVTLHNRNLDAPAQRKFSLNGELWRQDDKSERSVRDKIAMFSSQSSLDSPLFPNSLAVAAVTSNGRRLSKYKSSEDVCADDKDPVQKERSSFFDRTQSSFDLTDSSRNFTPESPRKYGRSTSLSQSSSSSLNSALPTVHGTKADPPRNSVISATPLISSFDKPNLSKALKSYNCSSPSSNSLTSQNSLSNVGKNYNSNCPNSSSCAKPAVATALARATSFSGSSPFAQDRSAPTSNELTNAQISRTNSLASTFRRPSEDMRRTSLNQLIEQRRRSISKLRGLVIPEKETVPIDQPIVDLPEIKSRDSILLQQIPKASIHDKWGSQSSLASTTSTASVPPKATTSFKMPAPQIHSKYSPAFKRKSLTVYGTSTSSINGSVNNDKNTSGSANNNLASEPPKSLESICSPTRSDYSFEFASSSPDGSRSRPKAVQRKTRTDYDDSDNDSAVSSSQSSISRGFSPPMSPVPSERSTVSSSERSYVSTETNYQRRSLIMESPGRTFVRAETVGAEREQFSRGVLGEKGGYPATERPSNSGGSNSRSPAEVGGTQNPTRQLRRSNSTDTNCSTSSTLTSGSQASAESLSRRVLKPQSVEAINRKNILASARCRSGRDLNGSPLIQRKFSDDEERAVSATSAVGNGGQRTGSNHSTGVQDVKIAYIEVTDPFIEGNGGFQTKSEEPKLPPKRSIPAPAARPPKSELLEPSNDLKMWVRTEAKALARSEESNKIVNNKVEKSSQVSREVETRQASPKVHSNNSRNGRPSVFEEQSNVPTSLQKKIGPENENESSSVESSKQRRSNFKRTDDQNDLLTILTTRSRSRSAIHVDDGTFVRSKSQMSLEDILSGKGTDPKLLRTQSVEAKPERNGAHTSSTPNKTSWMESRVDNRYRKSSSSLNEPWSSEDKPFVSKIPTLGRSRVTDSGEETSDADRARASSASIPSKIPSGRSLGRRSASVTDMKKALEKIDSLPNQHQASATAHSRFPSLDSSVDENSSTVGTTEGEGERCYGEQFGSISSLASSTSLISQQELAQLVEEASLEEAGRGAHEVIVVLLHKENPTGSVGITLAGGADCEVKEITVHRVLTHSIADKDGRVQRGDRILSINGRSTRGLTHRESLAVLKQPRSEVVLVVSRTRLEEGCKLRSRTASVETIVEGFETNGSAEDTAWGPPSTVAVYKDGAGLGFSLEGGRDSPLGDRPLVIKKIFTGGAAEKTGVLKAGDQLLEVNGSDVTRMSRIEAWSLMKKLHDGEVNLLVRHPATKSSS